MLRVCFSMLLIIAGLPACTIPPPEDSAVAQKPNGAPVKENILACAGIPAAGQKCGLAFPGSVPW
jgi:hypothetical protein